MGVRTIGFRFTGDYRDLDSALAQVDARIRTTVASVDKASTTSAGVVQRSATGVKAAGDAAVASAAKVADAEERTTAAIAAHTKAQEAAAAAAVKAGEAQTRAAAAVAAAESKVGSKAEQSAARTVSIAEASAAKRAASELKVAQAAEVAAAREIIAAQGAAAKQVAAQETAVRRIAAVEAAAYREQDANRAKAGAAALEVGTGVGTAVGLTGLALTAGLVESAKAAEDWETAWTGVRKVVDGSPEQLAALQDQLRGLTSVLPVTHDEIASVAAAAGQLGVARQDLAGFTKTAIALGVSTNLSAEDAATGLSQLGNIMGVLPDQADRAGSALVALGNAGASTESDILAMALRIGGAGRTIGLTEAQTLGFANALSSVGIQAQEGGSAISRVMIDISKAVTTGGQSLAGFAAVAGLSSAQFTTAFHQDAGAAISEFITGLGKIQKSGGNVFGTLDDLGLKGVEIQDTLLRAAGSSDQFASSLALGTKAWRENTALTAEAQKRYETAASKIAIARNELTNLAIDLGGTVLPVLAGAAKDIGTLASIVDGLPGPVRDAIVVVGGLAAVTGVAGGAALIALPKIAAFRAALEGMGSRGASVNRGLGVVGSFLSGPWGIALAAGTLALGGFAKAQIDSRQRVDALAASLEAQTAAISDQTRHLVVQRLAQEGVLAKATSYGLNLETVTNAALGNAAALAQVDAQLTSIRQNAAISDIRYGGGTANDVNDLLSKITGQSKAVREAIAQQRLQNSAMGEGSTAAKNLGGAVTGAAGAVDGLAGSASDATDAVVTLTEAQTAAKSAFESDTDVLGNYDPTKTAGKAAKATAALAKAREHLADVEARIAATTKRGKTTKTSTDDDPTLAQTQALRHAQEAVAAAQKAAGAATQTSLAKTFKQTIKDARQFSDDIDSAIKRGLNPNDVQRLLEEGPKKAGPLLRQLVSDHSGRLIDLANDAETALGKISTKVVEQARLTEKAVQAPTDQLTSELADAFKVSTAAAELGAAATAEGIARRLKLQPATVKQIAADFGIKLLTYTQTTLDGRSLEATAHGTVDITTTGTQTAEQDITDVHDRLEHLEDKTVHVKATTSKAEADIQAVRRMLQGLPPVKTVTVKVRTIQTGNSTVYVDSKGHATGQGGGGPLPRGSLQGGPVPAHLGTPGKDSVPYLLAPKEWVIRESATAHYGHEFMRAINERRIPRAGYLQGGSPALPGYSPTSYASYASTTATSTSSSTTITQPQAPPVIVRVPVHETHTRTVQVGDLHLTASNPNDFEAWAQQQARRAERAYG